MCLERGVSDLHVEVVCGEGLPMLETAVTIALPRPYVIIRLVTQRSGNTSVNRGGEYTRRGGEYTSDHIQNVVLFEPFFNIYLNL